MANIIKSINFGYAKDNLLHDVARMAGIESVKFFKESFRKGGFTDNSFQKWADRQSPLGGKKLMYNRGTLMQSIKKTEESNKRVVVSSDTPYSEIHNEGGYVVVTEQMKRFFWIKAAIIGRLPKKPNGKFDWSKGKGAKFDFCKRMALMKVGSKIKIPKRQFIGESKMLMNELDKQLQVKIEEYWEKA